MDAGLPPVLDVKLELSDSFGIYMAMPCMVGPVSQDGRIMAICRDVARQFRPGVNNFVVNVRFADGAMKSVNGSWDIVGY